MLHHVALVGIDVSEERVASRVACFGCYLLTFPSSPILVPLMIVAIHSSETSVLTKTTWYNITEDDILRFLKFNESGREEIEKN
jgi:hypothetical protein